MAIGIFDSGVGGLTVLKQLRKYLPREDFIYFGDTKRVPYGTRPKEEIIRFSLEIVDFLIEKGVTSLVVACNTIDSIALDRIKEHVNIPVYGIIDSGVDLALALTNTKGIGLIGTKATVDSRVYEKKIRARGDYRLYARAPENFVEFIEAASYEENQDFIRSELACFKEKNIDVLILACTHFPIISGYISEELGARIRLIDPAIGLGRKLARKLVSPGSSGRLSFYVTGDLNNFESNINRILSIGPVSLEQVKL